MSATTLSSDISFYQEENDFALTNPKMPIGKTVLKGLQVFLFMSSLTNPLLQSTLTHNYFQKNVSSEFGIPYNENMSDTNIIVKSKQEGMFKMEHFNQYSTTDEDDFFNLHSIIADDLPIVSTPINTRTVSATIVRQKAQILPSDDEDFLYTTNLYDN
jgi:hypothetical protein